MKISEEKAKVTDPAYLTVKEYAFQMHVHPETVKRWIKSGTLKAVRKGARGHWRIPLDVAVCCD